MLRLGSSVVLPQGPSSELRPLPRVTTARRRCTWRLRRTATGRAESRCGMGTGAFGPIPPSEFANNSASLSVQRGRVGGFFLVASIGGPSEACLSGRSNSKVVGGMRPAAFLVPHTWMNTLDDSKASVRAFWCLSAQSGHPDVLNQCPLLTQSGHFFTPP